MFCFHSSELCDLEFICFLYKAYDHLCARLWFFYASYFLLFSVLLSLILFITFLFLFFFCIFDSFSVDRLINLFIVIF